MGLNGIGRLPKSSQRERRNAMRFSGPAGLLFSGGIEVVDGEITLKLDDNGGLVQTDGLAINLAASNPGLQLSTNELSAIVQAPVKINASGIYLDFGTGLQNDGGTLKIKDSEIDHDALLNFVANEHIDWTNATQNLVTTGSISVYGTGTYAARAIKLSVEADGSMRITYDGDSDLLFYTDNGTLKTFFGNNSGTLGIAVGNDQYIKYGSSGSNYGSIRWVSADDNILIRSHGTSGVQIISASNEIILGQDNTKVFFGTAQDASIYYDGTNLIINTDDIGTGVCDINGMQIDKDGNILPVSLADASAPNNSIYYSSTASKLVYKDGSGTVNDLYDETIDPATIDHDALLNTHNLTSDLSPAWANITDVPLTFTPSDHASEHEVGGGDLINHDSLTGFVANEHIDWTNATDDLYTTGTMEVIGEASFGTTISASYFFYILTPIYDLFTVGTKRGARYEIRAESTDNNAYDLYGVETTVTVTGDSNYANLVSFLCRGHHASTGTVNTVYGSFFRVHNQSTGTITTGRGMHLEIMADAGTITTAYGILINPFSKTTGSIGTSYGIYLYQQANASTNWQIYSVGGNIFLGSDNSKCYWGTGKDASIYYDGTDLVINTNDVGTGACNINGMKVDKDGYIVLISSADSSAPNSSLYFSTTKKNVVWKDSGGTVHDLY